MLNYSTVTSVEVVRVLRGAMTTTAGVQGNALVMNEYTNAVYLVLLGYF
jgi:hypothetical protein